MNFLVLRDTYSQMSYFKFKNTHTKFKKFHRYTFSLVRHIVLQAEKPDLL